MQTDIADKIGAVVDDIHKKMVYEAKGLAEEIRVESANRPNNFVVDQMILRLNHYRKDRNALHRAMKVLNNLRD